MLRAALYARVSTEEQATEGASIPAQRKLLREYAQRQGLTVVAEFVDEGASARSADRPAFQQMIAAARRRPRPFDLILIHKTDRFARNREDAIVYKSLLRRECGVEVVSAAEQFEDSPTGKLLEGIMEVMAEFYSLNLSQEVKKGMREVAGQGRALGRPPFGYTIGSDGRLAVVPEEAAVVRWIYETYLAGSAGLAELATRLRKEGPGRFGPAASRFRWSAAEVRNILRNSVYVGDLIWNRRDSSRRRRLRAPEEWIVAEAAHAGIVSRSEFAAAGELLGQRRTARATATDYALRGLVRCLDCGGPMGHFRMQWRRAGGERCVQSHLACTRYQRTRACYFNHTPLAALEAALHAALRRLVTEHVADAGVTVTWAQTSAAERELAALRRQEAAAAAKLQRQLAAFEAGAFDLAELKAARERVAAEQVDLAARSAALQRQLAAIAQPPAQPVTAALAALEDGSLAPAERRQALNSVVQGLWYSRRSDQLKIAFKL